MSVSICDCNVSATARAERAGGREERMGARERDGEREREGGRETGRS